MNHPTRSHRSSLALLCALAAPGCGEVEVDGDPLGFTWARDTDDEAVESDSALDGASEDGAEDGAEFDTGGVGDGDGEDDSAGDSSADETGGSEETGALGDGDGDGDGDGGSLCLEQSFVVEIVRPQIGLVLDHSGSMNSSFNGILNRWQVLHDTTVELADRYEDRADFGVVVFPNNAEWCDVETLPAVEMGPHTAIEVEWSIPLRDVLASGGTPLAQAYDAAVEMILDADPTRPRALIVIADGGVDVCVAGDSADSIADQASTLNAAQIETFVVGIGSLDSLDVIAAAGGTGTTIPADDQPALHAAMEAVIGGAVSCELGLDAAPPSTGELILTLGGTELSRETTCAGDGWRLLTPDVIELCGVSCDAYRNGATVELDLICSAG